MKNIIKVVFVILIILYLFLYVAYHNGYYVKRNEENRILTEEKIKEYENDLKNGVDVSSKSYVSIHESYDNAYSRFLLKISNKVEKGFDNIIKFIFRKINNSINK